METLTLMLADVAAFIALASLKTSLLVAVILLIQKFAGSYLAASVRYLLWFTVVVSLVTPVGFDTPLLPQARVDQVTLPRAAIDDTAQVSAAASHVVPVSNLIEEMPAIEEPVPFSWPLLLPCLWLAGVFTVLGAIALSGRRFGKLVGRAHRAPENLQQFLRDCMQLTSCNRPVTLLESAEVAVPMIAGQLRPVLLLPQGLAQRLTRAQLGHVCIHELMHLQRGDIVNNWIVALVQALHWFNPVIWFAFFRMRQDRELACDAATLRHLAPAERAAYGHTLLQLNETLPLKPVPAPALAMLHKRSHLHTRILMLGGPSQRSTLHNILAMIVCFPLAALAFSQPVREPAPATRAEAAAAAPVPAEPAQAPPPAAPLPLPAPIVVSQAPPADAATNAEPGADASERPEVTLEITVDAEGQYFYNLGETAVDNPTPVAVEEIGSTVAKIMDSNPGVPVYVNADAAIEYGVVVKLLSTLQEAGATEPRLITQPPGLEL